MRDAVNLAGEDLLGQSTVYSTNRMEARWCPKIALLGYRRLRSASAVDFSTRSFC